MSNMYNISHDKPLRLEEFAEYLLRNQICREGHSRYYVFWVRKFLETTPSDPKLTLSDRMDQFLLGLQAEQRYADWQIQQAERAIRLYFHNFQSATEWKSATEKRITPGPDGSIPRADALAETRRLLRLRHYSYRTEQTYLEWIGGRGRPPSILFNERRRMASIGGPTAPAAAGITADLPTRLTLPHPQPIERFNEPVVLFVTICADKQENLFNTKPVQAAILDAWRMATQWRVGHYMLMPDHIHLFCVPGVWNPEPVSKWAAYWKRLSGQYERQLVGVWQRDVWDTQMRTLSQYEEKL